ncbi:MAG: c-type cytochrome domain-containing protein, partial [Chthoniobacteraceae bacterium]
MKTPTAILAVLAFAAQAAEPPTAAETAFFEKHIRPVLVEKCYDCHSVKAEKIKGGLTLDTRDGLRRGGDSGQVVIPGDAEKSALITAIRYQNSDLAMPPKKAGGKLPDAVIRDFEQWVKMGAPDPRTDSAPPIAKKYDTSAAKNWWAFQPLK